MIERITEWLMSYCIRKNKILKITGTGGPDDVYLIRYYVIKSKYFNFFIHQFLRSDRDDMHDHPWDFCTYLVRGAYTEHKLVPAPPGRLLDRTEVTRRTSGGNALLFVRSSGSWATLMDTPPRSKPKAMNRLIFRKATDVHKVLTDHDYKESEKRYAPLTLCFTGKTKRTWGFIKDGKWTDWREYLGLPMDTPGRG